jgi:uncharacterized protein YhaN
MKLLSLQLLAFGSFTSTSLDLAGGREGLHLVYGANEAGKSTALRALRQLLFGIPEQTTDAFLHPYPKLRIGGRLRAADGEILDVVRRKGRGSTLRAADDKSVVDEPELERFLCGVDEAAFASMLGIGHDDLVKGGRDIVHGGGDLGRLMFGAGSGVSDVGAVLAGLRSEADALFAPKGQKMPINDAIARLKERRAALKEAQLPSQLWLQHDGALKNAEQAKAELAPRLAEAQRTLSRLARIKEAQPIMAERLDTLKALATVADAVLLREGFTEERIEIWTRLQTARSGKAEAAAHLEPLEKAFGALESPALLLDRATEIEGIYQELGRQRKDAKDRIALDTRRSTLLTEARQILRGLREGLTLENAEQLRITKPEAARIRTLGAEYEGTMSLIDDARTGIPKLERALAELTARIAALRSTRPRPLEALRRQLARAEEALPLEAQRATAGVEASALRDSCAKVQARLGLGAVALGELGRLAVPSAETLRLFEARIDELDRRLLGRAEDIRTAEGALTEIGRQLAQARLAQDVPTESDLAAGREARDRAWRLVRRKLQGETVSDDEVGAIAKTFPGAESLPDTFEAALRRADETADRLRREAVNVAAKARQLADQAALEQQLSRLRADVTDGQRDKALATAEWIAAWQPLSIEPRSPREMRQWLSDFQSLLEKAEELSTRQQRIESLDEAIGEQRRALERELQAALGTDEAGASLGSLVRRARELVAAEEGQSRQAEELARDRKRRSGELDEAKSRLAALEGQHRDWQGQWQQAVGRLGLRADAPPAEANLVIDELKSFFELEREAEVLQHRNAGIDRDAADFARSVATLAQAIAPDLADRPADEAVSELQRRLTAAREAQAKRQGLLTQIEREQAKLRKADEAAAKLESRLTELCAEAGCPSADELPAAEARSSKRRELEARRSDVEQRLRQLGGGLAVEDFVREASAVDTDALGGEIERLTAERELLDTERSKLDQTIGAERTELGRMNGGDEAAQIAEDIQRLVARLERDAEQYARLRIASRVLELAMERFRLKSQASILTKASTFFRRITCGSFEGLRPDRDANGDPVLVGLRRGGKDVVSVAGMSDGTADQLYLALRLAGLEHYLDANEPMPFIVDDALIKFDDDRAGATLQVLAELSRRTQVIFFTHHGRLLDLAKELVTPEVLLVHRL